MFRLRSSFQELRIWLLLAPTGAYNPELSCSGLVEGELIWDDLRHALWSGAKPTVRASRAMSRCPLGHLALLWAQVGGMRLMQLNLLRSVSCRRRGSSR